MTAVCCASATLPSATAELPILNEKPWLGHFAVAATRRMHFTVSGVGQMKLAPLNKNGVPVGSGSTIVIRFGIEETTPDGKIHTKKFIPGSLESTDQATDQLEKAVIRGKMTGDAAFELTLERDRDVVSIGGRITDPGKLTKNPIRLVISARIPNVYVTDKKTERKEKKVFEKKIKDDRIELKWTDGTRHKEALEDTVDVTSKDINGPGIAELEVDISKYNEKKLYFSATENSAITLWNQAPAPLYEGFWIKWHPDAAKDPEGKSRFRFIVK